MPGFFPFQCEGSASSNGVEESQKPVLTVYYRTITLEDPLPIDGLAHVFSLSEFKVDEAGYAGHLGGGLFNKAFRTGEELVEFIESQLGAYNYDKTRDRKSFIGNEWVLDLLGRYPPQEIFDHLMNGTSPKITSTLSLNC